MGSETGMGGGGGGGGGGGLIGIVDWGHGDGVCLLMHPHPPLTSLQTYLFDSIWFVSMSCCSLSENRFTGNTF